MWAALWGSTSPPKPSPSPWLPPKGRLQSGYWLWKLSMRRTYCAWPRPWQSLVLGELMSPHSFGLSVGWSSGSRCELSLPLASIQGSPLRAWLLSLVSSIAVFEQRPYTFLYGLKRSHDCWTQSRDYLYTLPHPLF